MKKLSIAAALFAVAAVPAFANESADRWFNNGLAWYQHPCGLSAFAKYGQVDTQEVRRAYEVTKRNPAQCSKLFP